MALRKRPAHCTFVAMMVVTLALLPAGCRRREPSTPAAEASVQRRSFGKIPDGREVELFVLRNRHGVEATITNFGATLVSLRAPDRNGRFADVLLGYDTLDGYVSDKANFGGTIGRYANRIAHGKFTLNGTTYTLAKNNGENHLHGGIRGFNKVLWDARDVSTAGAPAVQMSYLSKDGEEGYPGNLSVQVTFALTDDNALRIDYLAGTDRDTVLNLTNHAYFNLAGDGDILQHRLQLHASRFTPVDATLIPTGEIREVKGTPFDFTTPQVIGARIGSDDQQLKLGKGYDHNFVLDGGGSGALSPAARVVEPNSGRVLQVFTTEPGIQFYTGNFLDGTIRGKGGKTYPFRSGFCLETQHFPDSPNKPAFPSVVLKPGQQFKSTTVYNFSTE